MINGLMDDTVLVNGKIAAPLITVDKCLGDDMSADECQKSPCIAFLHNIDESAFGMFLDDAEHPTISKLPYTIMLST